MPRSDATNIRYDQSRKLITLNLDASCYEISQTQSIKYDLDTMTITNPNKAKQNKKTTPNEYYY